MKNSSSHDQLNQRIETSNKINQALIVLWIVQCIPSLCAQLSTRETPFNQKSKKDQPTHFGTLSVDEQNAMHELQNKLVSPPLLALPYAGARYILYTDVCNVQAICLLLQEKLESTTTQGGYWSWSLNTAQQAYITTQCEWFAIVWSVLMPSTNLESARFTILIDHDSLKWALNHVDASSRMTR